MSTDTNVNQLIINKLTKTQYESIDSPSDTELYFVEETELNTIEMTFLDSSGTISLIDNTICGIKPTGTVTFVLPEITDFSIYHTILVQVYLTSAQTINTGATYFFNEEDVTFSAGMYNIRYEFDNYAEVWCCEIKNKGYTRS